MLAAIGTAPALSKIVLCGLREMWRLYAVETRTADVFTVQALTCSIGLVLFELVF
jgi:hypothetical protein